MTNNYTTNRAGVTHIYPKMPFVLGEQDAAGNKVPEPAQKPISDERTGDVFYELRELTFEDEPGCIFVLTHDEFEDSRDDFRKQLQKDDVEMGAIQFAPPYEVDRVIHKEGKERRTTEQLPFSLASKFCAENVISRYKGKTTPPITALVLWYPEEWCHLKYLDKVAKACPDLPIYVFHGYHLDKYGVDRGGNPIGSLWDTQSDMLNENELQPVIEHITNVGENTWIFGPPKQGKTWIMLCIVKSLLTGEPLFGVEHLRVPCKSKRVIYLCPEASRSGLTKRLKMLGLIEHIYDPITNPDGRLYLRSLSKGIKLGLDNTELLKLAEGTDIFIDTAIRYVEGDENNATDVKVMTEKILNLLAMGARSMWVAHHSGKSFSSATEITLENCARGSTEFAASLTNAIGIVQMDKDKNLIHFHYIDGRDMNEPAADMHLQGRPCLSQIGNFQVTENVERFKGRNNKSGPKTDPIRQAKIDFAKTVDGSLQDKANAVNEKFGSKHSKSTISEWGKEFDQDSGNR
ncbi:MAG TPA: AAA family ATPase [Candidatus Acidoferrum sp.]|nr:AAA family ATPase [Candidatus Acidoferrum sp.]